MIGWAMRSANLIDGDIAGDGDDWVNGSGVAERSVYGRSMGVWEDGGK